MHMFVVCECASVRCVLVNVDVHECVWYECMYIRMHV